MPVALSVFRERGGSGRRPGIFSFPSLLMICSDKSSMRVCVSVVQVLGIDVLAGCKGVSVIFLFCFIALL